MNFQYQMAVFSFCEDLTQPHAQNQPIGVLLVGQHEQGYVACVSHFEKTNIQLDPISQGFLDHLPQFFEGILQDALQDLILQPNPTLSSILKGVAEYLRNSFHVSHILAPRSIDLPLAQGDPSSLFVACASLASHELARHQSPEPAWPLPSLLQPPAQAPEPAPTPKASPIAFPPRDTWSRGSLTA